MPRLDPPAAQTPSRGSGGARAAHGAQSVGSEHVGEKTLPGAGMPVLRVPAAVSDSDAAPAMVPGQRPTGSAS